VSPKPVVFEAALAHTGNPFSIDRDGDATLRLQVPAQFVKTLADNYSRLFGVSFLVEIKGLASKVDTSR
jgi:hypothetical protein